MQMSDRALAAAISHTALEAQAELTGNVYYMVAQKLNELREIVLNGALSETMMANTDVDAGTRPRGLEPALVALRAHIELNLTDNRYYLAAHKCDILTFILRRGPQRRNPVEALPRCETERQIMDRRWHETKTADAA